MSADMHIGIDPGLQGGLVAISTLKGVEPIAMLPMPLERGMLKDQVDIRAIVRWILEEAYARGDTHIWLEKCPAHAPSQQSMRSMAITYGKLIGIFIARFPHMHLHRINCGRLLTGWQRRMFGRKFEASESKDLALAKAREIWPRMQWPELKSGRVNCGVVDAAVIADYGRRRLEGEFDEEDEEDGGKEN